MISISTATSAQAGILVKNRLALERMRTVDAVLFDKTGTLTKGNHAVVDHAAVDGWDRDEVLALAAAVEADSEHPIARAIVTAANDRGDVPDGGGLTALTGRGVQGTRRRSPDRSRWPGAARAPRPREPERPGLNHRAVATDRWFGALRLRRRRGDRRAHPGR